MPILSLSHSYILELRMGEMEGPLVSIPRIVSWPSLSSISLPILVKMHWGREKERRQIIQLGKEKR